MANKNSLYIGALTSFILDTKPYHSKLTEVQEIYQFSDSMTVHIEETTLQQTMTKAAWPYSYFSGGISEVSAGVGQPMSFHQLVSPLVRGYTVNDEPLNTRGSFKAFRDENTDLPLVPFAFDPKCLDGAGLSDAFVQRNGSYLTDEPLLEGHDIYLSQGAFTFQVKQTLSSHPIVVGRFEREYTTADAPFPFTVTLPFTNADSLVIVASEGNATQLTLSTIRITGQGVVTVFGLSAAPNYLPLYSTRPNDGVMAAAIAGAQLTDPGLTTDLARGIFTDYGGPGTGDDNPEGNVREGGTLAYDPLFEGVLQVTNIVANPITVNYEEFTLEAITEVTLLITGSSSGTLGVVNVGESYSSTALAFDTAFANVTDQLTVGDKFILTPTSKITVHYQAPLEAWSIINVNPRAYSRPVLTSTRYGYIRSQTLVKNYITIIDQTIPTCTLTLTCTNSTHFTLSSSAEPSYTGTATVGTLFNDGRISFTIIAGTGYTFTAGDKFFIEITNSPPLAEDLDIYYGFDMSPYDEDTAVYNTISSALANYRQALGYGYDGRFIGYDLASLGLTLAGNVVDGRQWRLRALPNLATPLNLHNVQGANPINQVNEIASNDPLNPNAVGQYDMANDVTSEGTQSATDPDTTADMLLWYANQFEVEYLNGSTWTSIGQASVGTTFTSVTHGLTFKIQQGAKPYIAGRLTSSWYPATTGGFSTETLDGGDTISFTIRNSVPVQTEAAGLTGRRTPRLIMYGSGFYNATPAKWTLTFISSTSYRLQGIYTTGVLNGTAVFSGTGVTITTTSVGNSYLNSTHHLHYTVYKGTAGLTTGDSISFETFARQPTFLVYGSVSGWQPDAVVDEWYWNGKIGFKIKSPKVRLFSSSTLYDEGTSWSTPSGTVTLNYIRVDTPSLTYTATSHNNGHWTLYRDGALVADGATRLVDKFIDVTMPTGVAGTTFRFAVRGSRFLMAEGHDLAIVRSTPGRLPKNTDFVLMERTRSDTLQISIQAKDTAHALALQALAPAVTDLRFVDHNANSGVPLSATSPETAVLTGWFGTLNTYLDKSTSTAEFRDASTAVVVRAAATGETVGKVESLGVTSREPVVFRWDPTFHTKYLPLNAQATVVSLGSGMNEKVNVNIRDTLFLLLSGGTLAENALFEDSFTTSITETDSIYLLHRYEEAASAAIADTGFNGFLPGYDNTQFDFELGTGDVNSEAAASGSYDAGVPLTDYFLQAQSLALLPSMTPQQQALYNQLFDYVSPWLNGNNIITTTMNEFIANIGGNPPTAPLYNLPVNWTPTLNGFGIPAVGMGMEIGQASTNSVGAVMDESLSILSLDLGYSLSIGGYGVGQMDALQSDVVYVFSPMAPPQPSTGVPAVVAATAIIPGEMYSIVSVGTTNFTTIGAAANTVGTVFMATGVGTGTGTVRIAYSSFDTPLQVSSPGAQYIQVSFGSTIASTPTFYIWRPTDLAPAVVPIVERVDARTFRFSVPVGGEMKLIAV